MEATRRNAARQRLGDDGTVALEPYIDRFRR